jgi:hypothetical protein
MTLDEQKAFVEAYDNTFCDISKARVAKIVSCHINKLDLSEFPVYELTSVIDALGIRLGTMPVHGKLNNFKR